ncbi:MAG: fibronectin type III domain-containing protein [Bacteroidetes bacterium]|nr:fibronectin type III domain-containing protein [Bacteroidota bacterium]
MKKNKNKKGGSAKRTVCQHIAVFIVSFIVKLGFHLLTVPQKIILARRVVEFMNGNPNFAVPSPTLADITTAIDALELAQQALPGGPAATEIRDLREADLDILMSDLQIYVEGEAKGDPEIALSSGMDIRDSKSPIGILNSPETLVAKQGAAEGSVKLKWKAVKKSSGYRIEVSTNPTQGWPMVYQSEKSSIKIYDLTPGTKYYFRVATLSHAGYEGYSPVATLRLSLPQD